MAHNPHQRVKLDQIRTDGGTQTRVELDPRAVAEYAEAMAAGDQFPNITLYWDGTDYWLADGFHRVAAAKRAGLMEFCCYVNEGTRRDAILYAVRANSAHGVRRTNADKRKAVIMLLEDSEWRKWSDNKIAHEVMVSDKTVAAVRRDLSLRNSEVTEPRTYVTKHGTVATMNTAAIGRPAYGSTAPAFEPQPAPAAPVDWHEVARRPLPGANGGYPGEPEDWPEGNVPDGWPVTVDEDPEPEGEDRTNEMARLRTAEEVYATLIEPQPELPAKLAVHFSSETAEHYTPADIIERVVACMGGIDLDPCSNSRETPNVPAAAHFTQEDDGLRQAWWGAVYMNPPYGREIGAWVAKLADSYEQGQVTEAIALVPARTDTQWFRRLAFDYHWCAVEGRLTFIGNNDPAPFPSAVFYLGSEIGAFVDAFEELGIIFHATRRGYCFGE